MNFYNHKNNIANFTDKNLVKLRQKADGDKLKEQAILDELKKYNLKDALISIGKIYQSMYHSIKQKDIRVFAGKHPNFDFLLRVDSLTKLAHLFIKSGANDYKRNLISKNMDANITWLNVIISNHCEEKIPINNETVLNYLCILYYEQIELQKSIKNSMCRNYLIYEEEFGELFKNFTKLTLQEYFYLCFILIVYLNTNYPYFYKNDLLNIVKGGKIPLCSDSLFANFIDFLSIDYKTYREKIKSSNNFMPIQQYPIIKTTQFGNEFCMVPVPPYLIEKVYNGIFFDFENMYSSKIKFREKFGLVFEKYVGKFIQYYATNANILSEKQVSYIKNKSDAYFTDWTVIEKDIVYAIEVKSISMPLCDVYNITTEDFVKKHILKAYKQIITKINDVDMCEELSFLKDKKIVPIIVFRNVPYINSKIFYSMGIENILENHIKKCPKDEFIKKYLQEKNIYTFNIDEFEMYWINRNLFSINALFETISKDSSESIDSLMKQNKHFEYKNPLFDKIYEEIIPIKEIEEKRKQVKK